MFGWKKTLILIVISGAAAIVGLVLAVRFVGSRSITLRGAVIRKDSDPNKESPIEGAEVVATDGTARAVSKSNTQGAFEITLRLALPRYREAVKLQFRHEDYEPLELTNVTPDQLYVASMVPLPHKTPDEKPSRPQVPVANISVRYSVKNAVTIEVGTELKTFQVVNKANVPCNGMKPCSPDGKWKASIGTMSLDAREGNEFRNARVSCIAGPCPFTSIERDNFSAGGRVISVSIRNWSDTTTFLFQAEAVKPMISDVARKSYPVIFDETMNFSLPAAAEGTSIEADVSGTPVVFPLGPSLFLSWAKCTAQPEQENSRLYRCEIKPGYTFK
jgi:hypothetical protein